MTANRILVQFSLALCLLYTVFLIGIDQTQIRGWCTFVAVLLQYLTLASLMWMAVEAQNMYADLVRVFDPKSDRFFLRAAIVAWGGPLVVTAISFGTGFVSYNHGSYCFVASYPLHFGVIIPVAIILLHNLVIFAMVIRILWKANLGGNAKHGKTFSASKRLKNALAISVLMGMTWLFGFFAIEDAEFIFSLIFCLINSFQGVIIFILFCLRKEDVLNVLRPYYMQMRCIRAYLSTKKRKDQCGHNHDTKTPYSEDQFTFEAANSTFDFESTTNPVTVMSEIEPEVSMLKPVNVRDLKSDLSILVDNSASVIDVPKIPREEENVSVNSDDTKLQREEENASVNSDDPKVPGEKENLSVNSDGAKVPREETTASVNSDDVNVPLEEDHNLSVNKHYIKASLDVKEDTDEKNQSPTTTEVNEIQSGSSPKYISKKLKIKSRRTSDGDHETSQDQVEHKRRIFSIYDIFVSNTFEEKRDADRNQILDGRRARKLDSLDGLGTSTETKNAGGSDEESTGDLTDDEDMLFAPIEIDNAIKDAHIDAENRTELE